jgi:hypothetical protein
MKKRFEELLKRAEELHGEGIIVRLEEPHLTFMNENYIAHGTTENERFETLIKVLEEWIADMLEPNEQF